MGLCRPEPLLPLYGVLSSNTEAFQRPPTRSGSWQRWQSRFSIRHDGDAPYQHYQPNTNTPNEYQRVPTRPTAGQQNTKDNSCHTPRTKAAEASRSEICNHADGRAGKDDHHATLRQSLKVRCLDRSPSARETTLRRAQVGQRYRQGRGWPRRWSGAKMQP